jgi:hypothetical protein
MCRLRCIGESHVPGRHMQTSGHRAPRPAPRSGAPAHRAQERRSHRSRTSGALKKPRPKTSAGHFVSHQEHCRREHALGAGIVRVRPRDAVMVARAKATAERARFMAGRSMPYIQLSKDVDASARQGESAHGTSLVTHLGSRVTARPTRQNLNANTAYARSSVSEAPCGRTHAGRAVNWS